ncbi:MAG: arginine N-succinyltransferase, partial [Phycisphaerales bacterium]|nr:arginine N-succinyltransferase [Phycisphaerales bacterium]
GDDESDVFMFSIEDTDNGGVVGTSQIKAQMGGPGNPNYAFKVFQREFRSASLGFGTTHLVARLHEDTTGPTEVGGLIIQPSYRGHRDKPGRLLSFVRFHFIGLHRSLFGDRLLAEMMAPVSNAGDNVFWDHIGRKFIPVKYSEADRFCQHNRRFIDELLPKEDIYLSLLPLDVLNTVAQVSSETVPARRLLERLGFAYKGFIDPFDGGPHLEAVAGDVPLVRDTRWTTVAGTAPESKRTTSAIVSVTDGDAEFRAILQPVQIDSGGRVLLAPEHLEALRVEKGDTVGITPLTPSPSHSTGKGSGAKSTSKPSSASSKGGGAKASSKPSASKQARDSAPQTTKPASKKPTRNGVAPVPRKPRKPIENR